MRSRRLRRQDRGAKSRKGMTSKKQHLLIILLSCRPSLRLHHNDWGAAAVPLTVALSYDHGLSLVERPWRDIWAVLLQHRQVSGPCGTAP